MPSITNMHYAQAAAAREKENSIEYPISHIYWVEDTNKCTVTPYLLNKDYTKVKNIYTGEVYDVEISKRTNLLDPMSENIYCGMRSFLEKKFGLTECGIMECDYLAYRNGVELDNVGIITKPTLEKIELRHRETLREEKAKNAKREEVNQVLDF